VKRHIGGKDIKEDRLRYIIVDEELGIFLGTHKIPSRYDPRIMEGFVIFSSNNPFGIVKAYSFATKKEAWIYMKSFLSEDFPDCRIEKVDCNDTYVDIVHLLKDGFHRYTFDMMDNIPMHNENIH
jgi:hypothetical protein